MQRTREVDEGEFSMSRHTEFVVLFVVDLAVDVQRQHAVTATRVLVHRIGTIRTIPQTYGHVTDSQLTSHELIDDLYAPKVVEMDKTTTTTT